MGLKAVFMFLRQMKSSSCPYHRVCGLYQKGGEICEKGPHNFCGRFREIEG